MKFISLSSTTSLSDVNFFSKYIENSINPRIMLNPEGYCRYYYSSDDDDEDEQHCPWDDDCETDNCNNYYEGGICPRNTDADEYEPDYEQYFLFLN